MLIKTIDALINLISNYLTFLNNIDIALKVANDEQKKIINGIFEKFYQNCKEKFDFNCKKMSYDIKKSIEEYYDDYYKNANEKLKVPKNFYVQDVECY